MRAEIVKSGCSLESRKFPAFYSVTIFLPNTLNEFFNRIGRYEPVASGLIVNGLRKVGPPAKTGPVTCAIRRKNGYDFHRLSVLSWAPPTPKW